MTAPTRQVVVHRDADEVARATAARLATALATAQSARGEASVVLTGGGTGIAVLAALAASPDRDALDWGTIEVWWGDERFLPAGDPERNETQARAALLDAVPLDPARVHPMEPAGGTFADDADAAAAAYAEELAAAALPEDGASASKVPAFDVLLLGLGPDAHVASLFPGLPGVRETERTVVGVHGSPKPPPTRVSLTLPAIRAAREVWCVVAGESKAHAVARALGGTPETEAPAAGVSARERVRWLLDEAAASQLPAGVRAAQA
ncbi:6-phosphogluconolactonase [Streptomyces sp. JJ66]|uniref:6-phosphogluconolactonase n=1 Tax=Streptomyces sp. JJ66 TaxID=2803843 RepID=UPI001C58CCBC|nr:6-phosphogluconolactonase [Streptomyces sp. JJ66]MBW1602867.1 6-phosphogluconolactonase [Streptomyces sp. JJ66]